VLHEAAQKDWREVEPAIFGTLLERALEKKERSRLGAHYTPRSYVERLVRPVVMEPLRKEWELTEWVVHGILALKDGQEEPTKAQRDKAAVEIRAFLERLQGVRILDPACGSGNFLYVTLDLIKTLEQEVQMRLLDVLGKVTTDLLEEFDPRLAGRKQVNPSQFLGIEINPRAAAIAELVIWIGYLQWHFKRYGTTPPPEPILQDFHNIEFRDAVLAYDGRELDVDAKSGKVRSRWGGRTMRHPVTGEDVPDPSDQVPIYRYINPRPAVWQEADYIVSNPPFIGNKRMKESLEDGYVTTLRDVYKDVPDTVDFVMYWCKKAADLVSIKKVQGFGLITTNSITQSFNRDVLNNYISNQQLFLSFAIPDHPWIDEKGGASVRIAMTVGTSQNVLQAILLKSKSESIGDDGVTIVEFESFRGFIHSDLSVGANVAAMKPLKSNEKMSFQGVIPLGAGFRLEQSELNDLGLNIDNLPSVIRPYMIGRDIVQNYQIKWVIDFFGLTENEALLKYPFFYQRLLEKVKPIRDQNNRESRKLNWWLFGENAPKLRKAIKDLPRFIVTPDTSKFKPFTFVDSSILPDVQLYSVVSNDAWILGVLESSVHQKWLNKIAPRMGKGNDLRWKPSVVFDPFPFPDATLEQKEKIRQLGERLDLHRKQVQAQHPEITITGMYNLLEKLRKGEEFTDKDREYNNKALVSTLKQIHDELDNAVLEAYGWEDLKPLLLNNPPSPLAPLPLGEGDKTQVESSSLTNQFKTESSLPSPSGRGAGGEGLQFKTESSLPSPSGRGAGGEGLTEIILDRLVTLNAQRAEEERNGHIRWLRPEYQAPNEVRTQTIIEGVGESEEIAIAPAEVKTFPKQPKDQLAAIRDILRTSNNPWTIAQIAAQFKNGGRYKNAISENLERLEWFGILLCHQDGQIKYWQHIETQQAS
jgi:hypothetical protein